MLQGKKIIVGVTGSIAAYKSASLVRLLVKEGAEVRVLMTPLARHFITPLTMATLSRNPVLVEFFDPENGSWNNHVDLGTWADLFLVAPATANTMARMASGLADNLLLTTYLSARCPVWIAPAMDLDMFSHPATQHNLKTLADRGCRILEPATGELASGLEGKGRMEKPETIVGEIRKFFSAKKKLLAKRILITAGPTYEPIDPVRFIGNYSSGRMGVALSEQAHRMGAEVNLVIGPVEIKIPDLGIKVHRVHSAGEMYNKCVELFSSSDCAILAAAVSDFRPAARSAEKIRRGDAALSIGLEPTPDIAASLGKRKNKQQCLIGFALETQNETESARKKLVSKNLDMIVLNSLRDEGAGFGLETNRITILFPDNKTLVFGLKSKSEVACDILDQVATLLENKNR